MPEPPVAEQGNVEALVGVLKDLRKFAETVRPDSTPAQVIAAKDSANRGLLLLDRLAAALARTKRELEGTGHALANADRALERAERDKEYIERCYNELPNSDPRSIYTELKTRAEGVEQQRDDMQATMLERESLRHEYLDRAEKAELALAEIIRVGLSASRRSGCGRGRREVLGP